MANYVALNSLKNGQFADSFGNVVPAKNVNVYFRNTITAPTVYPNADGTGTPLTQPLPTDVNGDVPGYVLSALSIDFVDVATGIRKQGEAISASDISTMRPLVGTHAARPAASPANSGLIYWETDTGLPYISDGTNWQLLKNGELGYAQITSSFTTTTTGTWINVTGLALTVTVGVRPILVVFDAYGLTHSLDTKSVSAAISEGSTQLVATQATVSGNGAIIPVHREARLSPTPGSHTYQVQIFSNDAGTFGIQSFIGNVVASLQVREL